MFSHFSAGTVFRRQNLTSKYGHIYGGHLFFFAIFADISCGGHFPFIFRGAGISCGGHFCTWWTQFGLTCLPADGLPEVNLNRQELRSHQPCFYLLSESIHFCMFQLEVKSTKNNNQFLINQNRKSLFFDWLNNIFFKSSVKQTI